MISVEEARKRILEKCQVLEPEKVSLLSAADRVLAEDIYAEHDVPPFANSAMDGYAVRAQDTSGATRDNVVRLLVIGEAWAGHPFSSRVEPGTTVRIATGAPLPLGADAVVRFEDTSEGLEKRSTILVGGAVAIYRAVEVGEDVRPQGEDLPHGALGLSRGIFLGPTEIGILATLGQVEVPVTRRPRIGLLATGDELLEIQESLTPGKIHNANEYSTAAAVLRWGGTPMPLGIARDKSHDLEQKIRRALEGKLDLLVTSGGVSVGHFDQVKEIFTRLGKIDFWQVAMKPGKPLAFGSIRGLPVIGLPGNPVSSLVAFHQFVGPAIWRILGTVPEEPPSFQAVLAEEIIQCPLTQFIRGQVFQEEGVLHVQPVWGSHSSAVLSTFKQANGLIVVPPGDGWLLPGELVSVQPLHPTWRFVQGERTSWGGAQLRYQEEHKHDAARNS